MSAKYKFPAVSEFSINEEEKQTFMDDIREGLSNKNKSINPKYFYDEIGSDLFNQITHHADYYLTGCELEILDDYKKELASFLSNEAFNLVELGPGEGIKTRLLIDEFLKEKLSFRYFPIDISQKYLMQIVNHFSQQEIDLETIPLNSDYLNGVKWLNNHSKKRNFLLFLGSSIGNFSMNASKEFLSKLHSILHPGDYVFIGFDLLKNIDVLLQAYNDSAGITREFNLNLLHRINKELGGNFNIDSFHHYGTYNVHTKAMESYLVSNKAQLIYLDALKKSFHFNEFETIHVESSQKYTLCDIDNLAKISHFKLIKNFSDKKQFFIGSLWEA